MTFLKKYNNWLNMYIEYSRRHYNRRWEIIKRENFMEYYDPWDWNNPSEETSPAYWTFRKTIPTQLVYKKHISNMLVLHKYRNTFRSWVPFYHSWIDPFDRRWATKTNKWPSFINIRSSKVDQGLRPGHTNLTYIREFLIFEVKPLLYKKKGFNRKSFYKHTNGIKGLTQTLKKAHISHNNFLIYKNFHKKRLKKKYEYISNLTSFDYTQMHSFYDRWFFHEWFNLMGWTSYRLMLKEQKILEFSEQMYTFNRISNLLENLLLTFNLQKDKFFFMNLKNPRKKINKTFYLKEADLSITLSYALKNIIKTINLESSFNKTLSFSKNKRNRIKSNLMLNDNKIQKKNNKNINVQVLKKMFNLSFEKKNYINFLNSTNNLIILLNYLQTFFFHLKYKFNFLKNRTKRWKSWEKKRKKLGLLPYYERQRRRIRRHIQLSSATKFSFHKLNYSKKIKFKHNINSLLLLIISFKDLLFLLRLVTTKNRLNFINLSKKIIKRHKPFFFKKKKQLNIINKSEFFLREKRFDIKNSSWNNPLFRLVGEYSLESDTNSLSKKSTYLTLTFFNKLMQLQQVKSLKQFVVKSRKILTYFRHMDLKIPTQAKSWKMLVNALQDKGHTYYPYYLRIYGWMQRPVEIPDMIKNKKTPFLLLSGPVMAVNKSLILSMRFKRKNLYFTLTDYLGRVLVSVSAASQGIKKGRYFSAHLLRPMYHKLVRCFKKYKISSYFFKVRSKHKGLFKYLRVFLQNRGILLRGLIDQIKRPHNGMRRKKTRRL